MQSSNKRVAKASTASSAWCRVKQTFLDTIVFEKSIDWTRNNMFLIRVFECFNHQIEQISLHLSLWCDWIELRKLNAFNALYMIEFV